MTDIKAIVEALSNRLTAQQGNFYHSGLWVVLLQLLAQGKPVSISQLAEGVGQSPDEVRQTLACCTDLEIDNHGDIVGMGLSLKPTSHRFQVNDHTLYTWCALDTILYAVALNQIARVTSPCPITQTRISLTIKPDGISDLYPATAVISMVIPSETETCCKRNFCDQGHLFSSAKAANCWLENQPEAHILPVKEAFAVGRQLVTRLSQSNNDAQRKRI